MVGEINLFAKKYKNFMYYFSMKVIDQVTFINNNNNINCANTKWYF